LTDYRRSASTLRVAAVGSGGAAPALPVVYCWPTEVFDTADLKDEGAARRAGAWIVPSPFPSIASNALVLESEDFVSVDIPAALSGRGRLIDDRHHRLE
jgi:hypothetical protein